MPVRQEFESQESIPEFLKDVTVEKDGKWIFEAETAQEVGNLKSTLKKERDARTKYEAEVKRAERFKPLAEADEHEFAEFMETWSKRGEKKAEDPGKQDKLHQRELKKREEEIAKIKSDYEKTQGELRDFKLWTPLRDVFIKSGGDPSDWEVARLELSSQGRFGFDDDGRVAVFEDGIASSVTPEKFFKEIYSEARPKFYRATGGAGSGAQNSNNGSGGRSVSISRAEAKDPKAYRAAKDRAEKAGVEFRVTD